jgi:hypothetical protein
MGSMRTPTRSRLIRLGLAALLAGVFTAPSRAADPVDWAGACYCRGGGTLRCTAGLTHDACRRQCDRELCDEWFWKERLPCWNWGYGG